MSDEWRILPKRDDEKLEEVNKPCDLCSSRRYPNKQYTYAGEPVVYCEECEAVMIQALKRAYGID